MLAAATGVCDDRHSADVSLKLQLIHQPRGPHSSELDSTQDKQAQEASTKMNVKLCVTAALLCLILAVGKCWRNW